MRHKVYVRLIVTPVNRDPCVNISSTINYRLISSLLLLYKPGCLEILKDLFAHHELLALQHLSVWLLYLVPNPLYSMSSENGTD